MPTHVRAHTRTPLSLSEESRAGTRTGLTTEAWLGSAGVARRAGMSPVVLATDLRARVAAGSRRFPSVSSRPERGQWSPAPLSLLLPEPPGLLSVRVPLPCPLPRALEPSGEAGAGSEGTPSSRPARQPPAARLLPADPENRELPQLREWAAHSPPLLPDPRLAPGPGQEAPLPPSQGGHTGDADGFRMSTLPKLAETKAQQRMIAISSHLVFLDFIHTP